MGCAVVYGFFLQGERVMHFSLFFFCLISFGCYQLSVGSMQEEIIIFGMKCFVISYDLKFAFSHSSSKRSLCCCHSLELMKCCGDAFDYSPRIVQC